MVAATVLAAGVLAPEVQAGKPVSLDFTIKALHDGRVSDPDTFTATGAIADSGFYEVAWYADEELFPLGWNLFTFTGAHGTFSIGWVPSFSGEYIGSGVTYPVEVLPGTGAYADLQGGGTLSIRAKNVYDVDSEGYRWVVDRIENITIKGTLEP